MGWETHRGKSYYIISTVVNGKRTRKSFGTGQIGEEAERVHLEYQSAKRHERFLADELFFLARQYEVALYAHLANAHRKSQRGTKCSAKQVFRGVTKSLSSANSCGDIESLDAKIRTLSLDYLNFRLPPRLECPMDSIDSVKIEPFVENPEALLQELAELEDSLNPTSQSERLLARQIVTFWLYHQACAAAQIRFIWRKDEYQGPWIIDRYYSKSQGRLNRAIALYTRMQKGSW